MPNPVVAISGSAVTQGVMSKRASGSAKRAAAAAGAEQQGAITDALNKQTEYYDLNTDLYEPLIKQGMQGQNQLSYLIGAGKDADYTDVNRDIGQFGALSKSFTLDDFNKDPSYKFVMEEGVKALDRGASAKRGYLSGAATKDLTRFAEDTASKEYGNAYNRFRQNQDDLYSRWKGLSGVGQEAIANQANLNKGYADDYSKLVTDRGEVGANATIAKSNANQGFYNSVGNIAGQAVGAGLKYDLFN